jgi:hypothetical protein
MGWRSWQAYEDAARERWKALPWRERYPLRMVLALAGIAGAGIVAAIAILGRL